ncbi:MAG: protein-glutamate methylesterase/protein-glutamine glutaminase [Terracidiphilus sp.]
MAPGRKINILIADDSAVMRSLLRTVIGRDESLEVGGTAADGGSVLSAAETLRPDLILLDVEMPVLDGLATLKKLRARGHKIPVIMCSSFTKRGAKVTIEALASGASDYMAKPAGQSGRDAALQALAQDLLPKIHALVSPSPALPMPPVVPAAARIPVLLPPPPKAQTILSTPTVLAIGVSTGGPAALDLLLPGLPATFPLPVLIVQHMPELFTRLFAERLNGRCPLQVREAVEDAPVRPGTIHIAKGNWHMEVRAAPRAGLPPTLHLNQGPLENHCRPAVDVLFRSVAAVYGGGTLAVVLTGMGSDGTLGCRTIRDQGGSVLAQDQTTSAVWGMPGSVVSAGLAHKVLPLNAIAPEILRLASRSGTEIRRLREAVV